MNIESGCLPKQKYFSKAEAKRVARLMTERHREGFHHYECANCRYFHVAHRVPAFLRGVLARPALAYGE